MTSKQLNSNDVVNSSCTNITYVNVTASTSAVVNISIGSMILANPSAHAILVSLLRFSVIDGATIIIDCSGCDNNNNKVSPALLPVVSIYIMSLQRFPNVLMLGVRSRFFSATANDVVLLDTRGAQMIEQPTRLTW